MEPLSAFAVKILITGFKPFLGESINPSELILNEIKHPNIQTLILPVEFKSAFEILNAEIKNQNPDPDYVIMLGQARGRKNICFEKIGLNWIQSIHPDESGFKPQVGAIDLNQNLALMTKFPVDLIYEKLKSQNLPVEISFSAGAYVCNDLYFKILSAHPDLKSVFVHVPLLPEQLTAGDNGPSMTLDVMVQTVELILGLLKST